jgi:hypothetical protein
MKLSKETTALLKNFASINGNFAIRKGSVLTTMSSSRNVFASVTVPEVFDEDFYIYDLSQFLGVVSLFEDPDIEFTEKVATIKEGKNSIKYFAADKSVLLLPPDKAIKFPAAEVDFTITAEQLSAIQKTSSVLSAPDLSIVGDGKILTLRVSDLKNPSTNSYEVEIGETDMEFTANLTISTLKMVNQSYNVSLSSKKISKWTAVTGSDMTVYVALESSSTFT